MKTKLKLIILGIIVLLLSGCSTVTEVEYHPDGTVKKIYHREGFNDFSNGPGKNLPGSHISVIGK